MKDLKQENSSMGMGNGKLNASAKVSGGGHGSDEALNTKSSATGDNFGMYKVEGNDTYPSAEAKQRTNKPNRY